MRRLLLMLSLLLLPFAAMAQPAPDGDQGAKIKAAHRIAAQRFQDGLASGVTLEGQVIQNGSEGRFEAFFFQDRSLVRTIFGQLISESYESPEGLFSGGNHSLPYKIEPQDDPATIVLNLLADGSYLKDPYWQYFTFVGEEASGYRFKFAPVIQVPIEPVAPGTTPAMRDLALPPIDVLLFSDPDEPQYLQLMSAEVAQAPADPVSQRHRSFYYYSVDSQGRLYTQKETGRDLDQTGAGVDFVEFNVEKATFTGAEPPELKFDTTRTPLSAATEIQAPVEVPIDTSKGYMIIPVSFQGSDKTFHFLFDTGASASLFSPAAAQAAGLTASIKITAHGHGSRTGFEVGLCQTALLGEAASPNRAPLAGFAATRISDNNKDLLSMLEHYGADGIIGISPLFQYVIRFDYPASKLTVFPGKLFDPKRDVKLPNIEIWLDVEDLAMCHGRLMGHDGEVVIDSGLQQDLAVLGETMDALGLKFEKVGEHDNTVLGGVKKFDYIKVPTFEIGPLAMQDKTASVTEDDQGRYSERGLLGFVGITLFMDGPLTLDLISQRMYIEAPSKLGYFPGLTPPPADKQGGAKRTPRGKDENGTAAPKEKEDGGGTKLPIDIGVSGGKAVG